MKKVGVLLPFESEGQKHMVETLGQALGITIVYSKRPTTEKVDGWILPYESIHEGEIAQLRQSDCPTYAIIRNDKLEIPKQSIAINFKNHETLPKVLRDREVHVDDAIDVTSFIDETIDPGSVVAEKESRAVWTVSESNGQQHHTVSIDIPELKDGESLFGHFDEQHMICLLPLLHFLRTISQDPGYIPPPLQACFMFDDPNLHWPTYGFIDFREMAESAIAHNYHVSFATIPLDGWYVHQPTAAIFKRHTDRLSLLIHGVNHVSQELGRAYTDEDSRVLLGKGLERIEKLEKKSGLNVARVMAPPHGACSDKLLAQMAAADFEAASISFGSLRKYNRDAVWLKYIGVRPMEIISGLPVFARFPISSNCSNTILEAAYLRRPIILMGHHKNVADGLQVLEGLAQFINSLGEVEWADMARISQVHGVQRTTKTVEPRLNHIRSYHREVWPIIRRQMTEFRDRSTPVVRRLRARHANG